MPKNIPGIVKRNRRRQPEKVRIVVQPGPYPLEQPGGQANVSGPMNPQMQPGMPPNGYDPMNPHMQPGMQANGPVPMNPHMQPNGPVPMNPMNPQAQPNGPMPMNPHIQPGIQPNGPMPMNPQVQPGMQANGPVPMNPHMQPNSPIPLNPQVQPSSSVSMTPPLQAVPGQVVPMRSSGQWRGDPNGTQPPAAPYSNQPWPANSAPMTPPQMPTPSTTNTPPYTNSVQQGRHTPPPANNIPSQPLSQPGLTPAPAPQRNPSQPIGNLQHSPVLGTTPAAAPPTSAPNRPSNSGLLGRSGPASLPGIAEAPTISAPLPHIFVEIDGKMVHEVRLDKPVLTVGRQDGRDIQIKHQSVSRTHARIVNERGTWFVEDAGSVNGIVFNGQRVHRTAITNGDRVFVAPNIALLYRIM